MPEPIPDVIVLLPGTMGSVLQKNGRDVWSPDIGAFARGIFSLGRSLRELKLERDDVDDGVVATRLMPNVHLIPGFWKIDGYSTIRDQVQRQLNLQPGQYIEFPYDWRRDIRISAAELERQSNDWLRSWRERSGNDDAKLILIGHSMGGLVSRYFLEGLDGWRRTRALITFGTPFRGSLNALDTLVNGIRKGPRGVLDMTDTVRSFTPVYQFLPIYPAYDPGDGQLVRVGETRDIPNLDADRAAAGLAFHREIEARVNEHLNDDEYRANRYRISPIVGIQQPTNQSARRAGNGVQLLKSYQGQNLQGDGTVPRVSATPIELSDDRLEMFCATKHASLQGSDAALTHLAGVIEDLYLDLGRFRAPRLTLAKLGLELDDAYLTGEPVDIRVTPDRPVPDLRAFIIDAETGAEVAVQPVVAAVDGHYEATFAPLPAGVYRLTVTGETRVEPAEDVFVVFDDAEPDE
jgi:pimeloyl-ACP methyl ester carboxylesterase